MFIHAILMVSIAGMIYSYPFEGHFRFTLSVVVLSTLLLYFQQLPVRRVAIYSGGLIFLLRFIAQYYWGEDTWLVIVMYNLPSFAYYLSYGLLFYALRIREHIGNMIPLLLLLSLTDIASNCIEMSLRRDLLNSNPEVIISSVVAVGVLRSVLTVYSYFGLRSYHSFIVAEDQAMRYAGLTLMIAKLKAELFYLQKSSHNIETVMQKGYTLYQKLSASAPHTLNDASSPAAQSLAIARDIHEVKKDYYRVINGMESILEHSPSNSGMKLSEIFRLVEQNTWRFAAGSRKKIRFSFIHSGDAITDQHFTLVSILDNLITNAMDAVEVGGVINVRYFCREDSLILKVTDNGQGIKEEELELIFAPGYSTKFSEETGQLSTGLGLAHVKNLTELLKGNIAVKSQPGQTMFTVTIPLSSLSVLES